jgi:hypothetical protein
MISDKQLETFTDDISQAEEEQVSLSLSTVVARRCGGVQSVSSAIYNSFWYLIFPDVKSIPSPFASSLSRRLPVGAESGSRRERTAEYIPSMTLHSPDTLSEACCPHDQHRLFE